MSVASVRQASSKTMDMAMWSGGITSTTVRGPQLVGWTKHVSETGAPYYAHHVSHVTQWLDPRLDLVLSGIARHNDVQYGAYRAALKFRDIQIATQMSTIRLATVINGLSVATAKLEGQPTISASAATTALLQVYADCTDPFGSIDLLVSWLLLAFDRDRSGRIPLISFKLVVAMMSAGWLEEKYRYAFAILAEATKENQSVSSKLIGAEAVVALVKTTTLLLESIDEAFAFIPNPTAIEDEMEQCLSYRGFKYDKVQTLQRAEGCKEGLVSEPNFIGWAMSEPGSLVWLPTMHRVAASESVKHEATCMMKHCRMYPIIGFRYRLLHTFDGDICQHCYWTDPRGICRGRKVREYCFRATAAEANHDFRQALKHKLSKPFRRMKKKKATSAISVTSRTNQPSDRSLAYKFESVSPSILKETTKLNLESSLTTLPKENDDLLREEAATSGMLFEGLASKNNSSGIFGMASTVAMEQKLEILRVVDQLDEQNRGLLDQLVRARDEAALVVNLHESNEWLETANAELEDQVKGLTERNRALLEHIRTLDRGPSWSPSNDRWGSGMVTPSCDGDDDHRSIGSRSIAAEQELNELQAEFKASIVKQSESKPISFVSSALESASVLSESTAKMLKSTVYSQPVVGADMRHMGIQESSAISSKLDDLAVYGHADPHLLTSLSTQHGDPQGSSTPAPKVELKPMSLGAGRNGRVNPTNAKNRVSTGNDTDEHPMNAIIAYMRTNKLRVGDIFKYFDVDQSGGITVAELSAGIRRMGLDVPSSQKLTEFFSEIDRDHGGSISVSELRSALMAHKMNASELDSYLEQIIQSSRIPGHEEHPLEILIGYMQNQKLRAIDMFKVMDKDENGIITIDELADGMRSMRLKVPTGDALTELFDRIDSDHDGAISVEELKSALNRMVGHDIWNRDEGDDPGTSDYSGCDSGDEIPVTPPPPPPPPLEIRSPEIETTKYAELSRQLLWFKDSIEDALSIVLADTDNGSILTFALKFSDGNMLCRLLNVALRKRGFTETYPVKSSTASGTYAPDAAALNFTLLENGLATLCEQTVRRFESPLCARDFDVSGDDVAAEISLGAVISVENADHAEIVVK